MLVAFQAGSSVMERNIAHKVQQLCLAYRYFLARAKAQINQCLEYAGRNQRAKTAGAFIVFGLFLLWLRKLGQTGLRLLLGVRSQIRGIYGCSIFHFSFCDAQLFLPTILCHPSIMQPHPEVV